MHSTIKDGRGSIGQKQLYSWLEEIYIGEEIVYEQIISDLNLRIDLYIPSQRLAIEYHGRQHYEYIPYFHKEYTDFLQGQLYDQKKEDYLLEHGVKVVSIPFNNKLKNSKELKSYIDNIPYPEYKFTDFIKPDFNQILKEKEKERVKAYKETDEYLEYKEIQKQKARDKRKQLKEEYRNSEEYKQQQIILKQKRKDLYQRSKNKR